MFGVLPGVLEPPSSVGEESGTPRMSCSLTLEDALGEQKLIIMKDEERCWEEGTEYVRASESGEQGGREERQHGLK